MQQQRYDDLYKIIIIGDSNVGKTNLAHRFVKENSQEMSNIAPTIGVQFSTKVVTLEDGTKIKAQIWDTAGQQHYRSIAMAHYRRALGALLVYDITKQRTFHNLKRWLSNIREHADEDVVVMLVGNKTDLRDKQVISTIQGKKFAKAQGMLFEETSALTSDNVENTFKTLLQEIRTKRKQIQAKQDRGMTLSQRVGQKDNSNCEC